MGMREVDQESVAMLNLAQKERRYYCCLHMRHRMLRNPSAVQITKEREMRWQKLDQCTQWCVRMGINGLM